MATCWGWMMLYGAFLRTSLIPNPLLSSAVLYHMASLLAHSIDSSGDGHRGCCSQDVSVCSQEIPSD